MKVNIASARKKKQHRRPTQLLLRSEFVLKVIIDPSIGNGSNRELNPIRPHRYEQCAFSTRLRSIIENNGAQNWAINHRGQQREQKKESKSAFYEIQDKRREKKTVTTKQNPFGGRAQHSTNNVPTFTTPAKLLGVFPFVSGPRRKKRNIEALEIASQRPLRRCFARHRATFYSINTSKCERPLATVECSISSPCS